VLIWYKKWKKDKNVLMLIFFFLEKWRGGELNRGLIKGIGNCIPDSTCRWGIHNLRQTLEGFFDIFMHMQTIAGSSREDGEVAKNLPSN
jgi:hypothetical protein